ncbi:MAG TPA: copper-binding protein, partial [Rhodoferax sp.]
PVVPASAPSTASEAAPARVSSHQAVGTVQEADAPTLTVSISHQPIASLKWPAMTMEFKVANAALMKDLKPGAKVAVEFVERAPGEWVITSVKK